MLIEQLFFNQIENIFAYSTPSFEPSQETHKRLPENSVWLANLGLVAGLPRPDSYSRLGWGQRHEISCHWRLTYGAAALYENMWTFQSRHNIQRKTLQLGFTVWFGKDQFPPDFQVKSNAIKLPFVLKCTWNMDITLIQSMIRLKLEVTWHFSSENSICLPFS